MHETTNSELSNFADNTCLYYAAKYLKAGYCPIPLKPRTKEPVDKEWEKLRLNEAELEYNFSPTNNVGVTLGDAFRPRGR